MNTVKHYRFFSMFFFQSFAAIRISIVTNALTKIPQSVKNAKKASFGKRWKACAKVCSFICNGIWLCINNGEDSCNCVSFTIIWLVRSIYFTKKYANKLALRHHWLLHIRFVFLLFIAWLFHIVQFLFYLACGVKNCKQCPGDKCNKCKDGFTLGPDEKCQGKWLSEH